MNDGPSQFVAQPLQNHVHLISGHRFALQPRLDIEGAFRYLIDAPTIVKQTAPMSWMYVQAPQDGTVWLEWIPPRNGEYRFSSDGYVWGDPEQTYRHQFGGFVIELMVHTVGFRPSYDSTATHARTRYHFISKDPNTNAAPPDPSLWIVHYHQGDHNRLLPVGQVPISGPVRHLMGERSWLEKQGRLERKDFMLHDKEQWPTLTVPGMQHPGMYGNPMMQHQSQATQPAYSRYPATGPAAKRQRTSGPSVSAADAPHDSSIEDEENPSLGDFFDHMPPREISMSRYMQHHRWMEEVFSSPYASSQIVPPDLGLGLMGELKGLTEGILEPPSPEAIGKPAVKPMKAKEAQPFTALKQEQLAEFNKRVEKHLEEGQAEIERMKKEHAEKMAEWKKSKTLMHAEKRLRNATWEGHESALPAYRLEVPATNEHAEDGASPETVEQVVKDVENLLGVNIKAHEDAALVERGGLEKEERFDTETAQRDSMKNRSMSGMQVQSTSGGAGGGIPPVQSSISQLLQQPSATMAEASKPNITANLPQATFQTGLPAQPQSGGNANAQSALHIAPSLPANDLDGMDMDDTSMTEDMNMDVNDTGDIDFVEHDELQAENEEATPGNATAASIQTQAPTTAEQASSAHTSITVEQAAEPITLAEGIEQQLHPSTAAEDVTAAEQQIDNSAIAGNTGVPGIEGDDPGGITSAGDNDLFNDGTFDDLANMDGGNGDDGLIDFDGGMGMDGLAFGDAMHGMDASDAGGQGGTDQAGS